jgi:tetraacyldisaccharide-1-P 4'-kinase
MARQAGYRVQKHVEFRDHAVYEQVMIRDLLRKSGASGCRLAITGKDWVKWRASGVTQAEVIVLEPELKFEEEARAVWNRVLWGEG